MMRATALAFLLVARFPAAAETAEKAGVAKHSPAIQKYYQEALELYAHGDFRNAIIKWTAILKEDPEQKSAHTMIIDARRQLVLLTKARRRRAADFIALGQYRKALLELQALLDQDPDDPELEAAQRRLETVIKMSPQINAKSRAGRAAMVGISGFLALPPDLKLAHNGLRYARELAPSDPVYKGLLELLYSDFPDLTSADAVTPGMKLLEYKHAVALHQIYDAKHHLAVLTLNEILALEPEDLMALKRQGSAYYSLGRMDEARTAWSAALRLAPGDKTLAHFLSKIKKYKSSAATP